MPHRSAEQALWRADAQVALGKQIAAQRASYERGRPVMTETMQETFDRTLRLGDAEHDVFVAGGSMHVTTRAATASVTSVISETVTPTQLRSLAALFVEAAEMCEKQAEFAQVFGYQMGQAA